MKKKRGKRANKTVVRASKNRYDNKINFVWKNLLFFFGFFLAFFIVNKFFFKELQLFQNLFSLLAMIFGALSGALVIVLLVLFFMKVMKKK